MLQQFLLEESADDWDFIEPVDGVFQKLEAVTAMEEAQKMVLNGNRIPVEWILGFSETKKKEQIRLYDYTNKFIGIYSYIEESQEYKPVKLFMD